MLSWSCNLELTDADGGDPTDNPSRDELVDRVGLDVGRLEGVNLKQLSVNSLDILTLN